MKHFKLMKGILACLLSLALVVTCFTSVGAKAEETSGSGTATVTKPDPVTATFDWSTNTISAGSEAVVYVLKAKTGNAIKKGAKAVSLSKVDKSNPVAYAATMTELGIKKAKNEVYLYVCTKEFEEAATNITANLVIKAPAAKKLVGKIDYTKADGDDFNVISAKATDNSKKEIKNPEIWWSTEADGTYYPVNSATDSTTRKYADGKTTAPEGFDGQTLKEMLTAGGTIYIKMAGASSKDGDPQFGSQAVKVKIAKQAKAPKVKIDVKKDTIALKNGFDFAIAEKDSTTGEYEVDGWYTLLPNLKTATVKEYEDSIQATVDYTPLDKKDSNAGKKVDSTSGDVTTSTYSYTAYKFKALSIDKMLEILQADGEDVTIAVRKSATEKKPASAASYIELSAQGMTPIVYTQENVAGEYLVATATDFEKKGLTLGTIVPFPGSVSGDNTNKAATVGYAETFEVGKTSDSGDKIINVDNGGSTFEYAIIAQKDMVATGDKAIDWSTVAWKKFDPAKTKITGKLKTKYSTIGGTKTTAQLDTVSGRVEAGSGATTAAQYSSVKNFLVIRRQGDKSGIRASWYILLYVAKEGKAYNLYSTVDNGKEADKYIIKFVKYTQNADGTYGWNLAEDVEDVKVWIADGDTKAIDLPKIDGADLFKAETSGSGYALTETSASGKVTLSTNNDSTKGKYVIANYTKSGSGETVEYMAIREYANIKVVGTASDSGEAVANSNKTLATVKAGKISGSGDVTVYVGTEATLSTSGWAVPGGYSASGENTADVSSASGEGFTGAAFNASQNKCTVTVNTAAEVTVEVSYPVHKVKVTYDINKGDKTTTATAPSAVYVNAQYKLASVAAVDSYTATTDDGDNIKNFVVSEWNTKADGSGEKVTTASVFNEDTTIYAKWVAKD